MTPQARCWSGFPDHIEEDNTPISSIECGVSFDTEGVMPSSKGLVTAPASGSTSGVPDAQARYNVWDEQRPRTYQEALVSLED